MANPEAMSRQFGQRKKMSSRLQDNQGKNILREEGESTKKIPA